MMILLSIIAILVIMFLCADALDRNEREQMRWDRRQTLRNEVWEDIELIEFFLPYEA